MTDPIIAQAAPERKALAELTAMASQDLCALGLTDAHIAALDAAEFTALAGGGDHAFYRRRWEGAAMRATERAAGVTLADCAAVLGYTPEGTGR